MEIKVPQIGEGLVEARILCHLKAEGDFVERDEPLMEIETDKATLVVESPASGRLIRWEAEAGAVLPIGATVAIMESIDPEALGESVEKLAEARCEDHDPRPLPLAPIPKGRFVSQPDPGSGTVQGAVSIGRREPGPVRNRETSPRVQAYCRRHGVSAEEMSRIPRANSAARLQVADVERWLPSRSVTGYQDKPLSPQQSVLAQCLVRAQRDVVPASIELECDWDAIEATRTLIRQQSGTRGTPSSLTLIAWCVVQSMKAHPLFRSAIVGENIVRQYNNVHLGIAVGLPNDELAVAAVAGADRHGFREFALAVSDNIDRSRAGETSTCPVQLFISNMAPHGIRSAQPVVIPPAVATLLIGAPFPICRPDLNGAIQWARVSNLVLAFDHRLMNGVGAARFLREVKQRIERLPGNLLVTEPVPPTVRREPGE